MQLFSFRFRRIMKAILSKFCIVAFPLLFPMTVAAHRASELRIELARDRMVHLETRDVRLRTREATSGVSQLFSARLDAPCSRDGVRILHRPPAAPELLLAQVWQVARNR